MNQQTKPFIPIGKRAAALRVTILKTNLDNTPFWHFGARRAITREINAICAHHKLSA